MQRIHVMAGVIWNSKGELLIAKRPLAADQGGLWEFPGGKLEDGEEPFLGLIRELQEELGIEVMEAGPLITVTHDYSDKAVTLDVWEVSDFEGDARGVEGQEVRWVKPKQLSQFEFPAANAAIVEAVLANLAES